MILSLCMALSLLYPFYAGNPTYSAPTFEYSVKRDSVKFHSPGTGLEANYEAVDFEVGLLLLILAIN